MPIAKTISARLTAERGFTCASPPSERNPVRPESAGLFSRRKEAETDRPRRHRKRATAVVAAILSTATLGCFPSGFASDDCRYEAERNATIPVESATRARVVAGAGTLEVRGYPDLDEIRIRGRACASDQETLDGIQLETRRDGNEISIEAKQPGGGRLLSVTLFNKKLLSGSGFLDLEIDVPVSLGLDITDGAGSVVIRDTGSLRLSDGSGSVRIENVAGDVSVRDGSGSVEVRHVSGDVEVKDGSSSFSIADVAGSVRIQDGSGSIKVQRVARDVTVASDGSGSILVSQVEGDFVVKHDGSGSVRHQDVRGRVSLPK